MFLFPYLLFFLPSIVRSCLNTAMLWRELAMVLKEYPTLESIQNHYTNKDQVSE